VFGVTAPSDQTGAAAGSADTEAESAGTVAFDSEGCALELGRLVAPKDPAAEGLVIPGDPFRLSTLCEQRAQRLESFGLLLFVLGLALNLLITFVILGVLPL
jgi:hypothetical protein